MAEVVSWNSFLENADASNYDCGGSDGFFQGFDAASIDLTSDSFDDGEIPEVGEIEFKSGSDSHPGIKYPAILVCGMDTEEEFLFFRNRKSNPRRDRVLPLYCMVEDQMVGVGDIAVNLQSLLDLGYVSQYYRVFLLESDEKKAEIDVRNPGRLARYITF